MELGATDRLATPIGLGANNPRKTPTLQPLTRIVTPFMLGLCLAPLTGTPRRTAG
jgi:hypothetical protein